MNSGSLMVLAVLVGAVSGPAQTPLTEARSTLDKWVETRQLISKTRSDWQADKEILEQTLQLFQREAKAVEDQLMRLGTNSDQVGKERTEAEALLKSSGEGLERAKQFAADFETRIRAVVPRLPVPLQETLKPLLNRMPTNSVSTRMPPAERMQVVVGILSELDKFNNAVTLFNEKLQNGKGEEVAVQTVYVGLGAAYFVNEAGDFAGSGSPGPPGWEWSIRPDLSAAVREVIRIYRNEQPARFVSLPVTIK
jgi:hypothetical protein